MIQTTELKIHQPVTDGFGTNYIDFNIDLNETIPLPVERSIIDVNAFADRKADHTKTIVLPGTSNNNKVFSAIFQIDWSLSNEDLTQNYTPQFNPSLKVTATIYCNGIIQLSGNLQLLRINIIDEQQVEYECLLIGTTANLFQDIGAKNLNALDLTEFDHEWTSANIIDSWTASVGEGYVYPLIDYGLASNEKLYSVDTMFLSVYVKTIIDKIFEQTGYRYASTFLNSERFKRLIIPYSGKSLRLSNIEIITRNFVANRTSDSGFFTIPPGVVIGPPNYPALPFDKLPTPSSPNGYDVGTFMFTVQANKAGYYTFYADIFLQLRNTSITYVIYTQGVELLLIKNGLIQSVTPIYIGPFLATQVTNINVRVIAPEQFYKPGDVIYVSIRQKVSSTQPTGGPNTLEYQLLSGSTFSNVPSAQIVEGNILTLSAFLPSDVLQSDFLASIIKMFNLYVDVDLLDAKKLIIEPRDTFYLNDVIDISNTVDVNNPVVSEPLGALRYKNYIYQFHTDTDLANKQHQDKFIDPYGFRKFKIINDFVKDEYKTEVIFAPTPLRDSSTLHTRVTSKIWFLDSSGQRTDSTANIRILYYGGIITPGGVPVNWQLFSRLLGSIDIFTDYPYAGHLDSISNPQFDLNFGVPVQIQYAATKYTDNNLFNLYHKNGIQELIDPDSRIVTFHMHISDVQRQQLSFRKQYKIDKQYYRLYQVSFDASSPELTVCKFLKLKHAPPFAEYQSTENGGDQESRSDNGGGKQIWQLPSFRNNNSYEKGVDVNITGENNNITNADKLLINSKNNIVNGLYDTILGGQNNVISNEGITLLNCDGYEATYDNEAAIANIQQPQYLASTMTKYDVSALLEFPIDFIPTKYGYWTEVTEAYATRYFGEEDPEPFAGAAFQFLNLDAAQLINLDGAITIATSATKVRGEHFYNIQMREGPIILTTTDQLGDSGTGFFLIEVYYRLHRLYQ